MKGLEGFTDADGAMQEHRHAITRYAFLIDGGAVSWSPKKQEIVTLSTAESEYVAATHTAKEAIYGFTDLLVRFSNRSPTRYRFIQTRKPLSHSPTMGLITLAPNTLIYGIILFDSS